MSIGKGIVWAAIIFVFGPIAAGLVIVGAIVGGLFVAGAVDGYSAEPQPAAAKTKIHKAPARAERQTQ